MSRRGRLRGSGAGRGQRHPIQTLAEHRVEVAVGAGSRHECPGTGGLEPILAIALSQPQDAETRAVALLGVAAFLEDRDRFGSVVVTSAEEMPVQEAFELFEAMDERLGRQPELVVVNAVYPPLPARAGRDASSRLWARRRAVNEHELARLAERWNGPMAEVPLEPIDAGPALVGVVGQHLRRALEDR